MGKVRTARKPVKPFYGTRKGTKRSDRHWLDPEGNTWDSRYEYLVFRAYKESGKEVRRTTKGDTFSFVLPITRGKCRACGSTEIGQQRTYTPDLYVTADNSKREAVGYYVEAKGYLRPKERSLLRAFYKENPDATVRYLLQRDFPSGTKSKVTGERSSIVTWFHKFLPNARVALWSGNVPKESDWTMAETKAAVVKPKAAVQRRRLPKAQAGVSKQATCADSGAVLGDARADGSTGEDNQ